MKYMKSHWSKYFSLLMNDKLCIEYYKKKKERKERKEKLTNKLEEKYEKVEKKENGGNDLQK